MSAINEVSKIVRVVPGNFTFCGTKDKRGITTQRITVKNCSFPQLERFN